MDTYNRCEITELENIAVQFWSCSAVATEGPDSNVSGTSMSVKDYVTPKFASARSTHVLKRVYADIVPFHPSSYSSIYIELDTDPSR
jgi:hypothetical protein